MEKNKSQKQIYKLIEKNMPENLNDAEKIAYIIMIIAQNRSFSSKYYWSSVKNRERIYDKARKTKNYKFQEKRQIMCVTAASMLRNIAKKFDIDIYYYGAESGIVANNDFCDFVKGEHIVPIYKTQEGKFLRVDLERNLDNIQAGKKWTDFGTNNGNKLFCELDDEEVNNIMKKIGYISDEREYFDYYIETLLKQSDLETKKQKINLIFQDKNITERARKMKSSVDIFRYYFKCIRNIEGNEQLYMFGGIGKNQNNKRRYSVGVLLKSDDYDTFWFWSNRNKSMVEISKEELKYFIKHKGLRLVSPKYDIKKIIDLDDEKCKSKFSQEDILIR